MKLLVILIIIIALIAMFFLGKWSVTRKIIELQDIYSPKLSETATKAANSAVLQLQNEIAASRAIKKEALPDGRIQLTLKVVK